MTDITPSKVNLQLEALQYRAAASEGTMQSVGSSTNFINSYQYDVKDYFINGPYGIVTSLPVLGVDGLYIIPFDLEIINIGIFNLVNGSSGTTEIDVKKATTSGGSFTSIFSTTPKITSAAGNNVFALSYAITKVTNGQSWAAGTAPTGVTLGVLSGGAPYNLSAGNAIRVDLIQVQTNAQNCGLLIYHRPR